MLGKYHFASSVCGGGGNCGGDDDDDDDYDDYDDLLTTFLTNDREPCEPTQIGTIVSRRLATTRKMMSVCALLLLLTNATMIETTDNSDKQQHDDQLHPSLFVDTKYWIRNTEFGERDNWRSKLRPCTLLERIVIEENESVISLGDAIDNSFGSLESSSVRELLLAIDGVLLLEEDTIESEQAYIKFLNESGDCFDSSILPDDLIDQYWFRFEQNSDELSWFNGANWVSVLNQEIAEMVPDSHQIPCSEDVVVFGSRRAATWSPAEADERSSVIPFKVNFRPSEQMMANKANKRENQLIASNANVDSLLVSKLKIGDKSYTQDEFDQLIRLYGDSLFDFNDEKSIFNLATSNQSGNNIFGPDLNGRLQTTLTIDETSIQATELEHSLCLDEAGCLCGNEKTKLMEIICSFNQPLELNEMLCLDPIPSSGYCNRICATSILINMAPTKFSERFVLDLLNKSLSGEVGDMTLPSRDYFSNHIFVGSRRIDHTRYEITLRLVPTDNHVYGEIIGRDLEFSRLVEQQLDKAAIKSFYGIKTIHIKASVLWRRNNRNTIFWLALIATLSLFVALFVHYDDYLTNIVASQMSLIQFIPYNSSTNEVSYINSDELNLVSTHQSIGPKCNDHTDMDARLNHNVSDDQEFSMIELDARSHTDSTCGLLKE